MRSVHVIQVSTLLIFLGAAFLVQRVYKSYSRGSPFLCWLLKPAILLLYYLFLSLLFKIVHLLFSILLNLKIVITKEKFLKISITNMSPPHAIITECPLNLCTAFFTHSCYLHNYSVRRVIWQSYDERHFARLTFNVPNYHFGTRDSFQTLRNP